MGLLNQVEVVPSTAITTGGTTTIMSGIVDAMGCEGILWTINGSSLNAGASTAATSIIRLMGSTGNSTAGMIDLGPGAAGVLSIGDVGVANGSSQICAVIDQVKPIAGGTSANRRYFQLAVDLSSEGCSIVAIKYGMRVKSSALRDSTRLWGSTEVIAATST